MPVAYVRRSPSGIEMTPDRQIQEAIRGVFFQFERLGTLRQVLLWYHQQKVALPVVHREAGVESIRWQLPHYASLLRLLKNPAYAGAFAWGRTCARSRVVEGRSRKSGGHRVAMAEWPVLLKDHHEAYISWERYVENQRLLNANQTRSHPVSCGAARRGSALLAELLRCALRPQAARGLPRPGGPSAALLLPDGQPRAGQPVVPLFRRGQGRSGRGGSGAGGVSADRH